ncbi:MAG TPA: ROK family protein [Longimicrobiaceae bacterium]|nr:ROK family protein [Longimicrobiaceae bacterium]
MSEALSAGIDIGGTKAEVALVRGREVVAHQRFPTGGKTAEEIVGEAAATLRALLPAGAAPRAVGVGVAGRVEPGSGLVFQAPNLGWKSYPLGERLTAALRLPVSVLNDVQAATYAEGVYGAGRGASSVVALFIGTGIGSGILEGGSLLRGCSGSAGEWGHSVVDYRGALCTCGNRGCLETLAAGWGIARLAREAVTADPVAGEALLARVGGEVEHITTRAVGEAATAGDPLALGVFETAAEALGAGLASIVNALDPCRIVLGGGVMEGYPTLLKTADERMRARLAASVAVIPPLMPAELGRFSGVIGAAEWASANTP